MPNLLIISQAVPPVGGSHSTRITHLINELSAKGWEINVLTTQIFPGTPFIDWNLQEKIPSGVKFIRSFPGPLHSFAYRRPKTNKTPSRTRQSKVKSILIPDTYIEWLPGALIDCLLLNKGRTRPDIIMSSAVPYTAHLIGLVLSSIWGIPWVADYGDPWVYDPGHPRQGIRLLVERYLESKVVKKCSAIVVTTETTKQLYIDKYSVEQSKIRVIPMGFDPKDFAKVERDNIKEITGSYPVRFVYIGRLEPESRDVNIFFQALKKLKDSGELKNTCFEFIGGFQASLQEKVFELGLQEVVKFCSWIEHSKCMQYLTSADYLLLFGNNNSIQVPGKIFNYVGSETPIIYLANTSNRDTDPCVDILEQSGVKYWYVENSQVAIENLLTKVQNIRTVNKTRTSLNYNFTWAKRGEELSQLLFTLQERS